ncbi:hypothetical protein GJ744_005098 [Endocarpon pusillum]|uniref:Zn(2)-C6 fungal-type domain-containing protein n=1 Tax=Endocarpon pusillum TaxID=364733 RepID=A0A8H7AQ92_9EURO|nr:hypothetical protein GJ744_005098 [Endocarpon pusillum]
MSGRMQSDRSQSGRSSENTSSPRPVLGKMILPRLDGASYETSSVPKRTGHACERCRALKAKCTGGARCEKCVLDKAECKYGDGKRERNKKEMASQLQKSTSLILQNEQLLAALREVTDDPAFDAKKHPNVLQLLSKYPSADSPDAVEAPGRGRRRERGPHDEGETATVASVGSPGAADSQAPPVSLGIGSGASGYIGKSSEISWLQRAQEQMARQQVSVDHTSMEPDDNHPQGSYMDYHMDEANLLAVDEDTVNPMEVPPLPVAKALATAYFKTVHNSFPLVAKDAFMDILISQFHVRPPLSWEGRRWLSLANIIFAVGAKWLYLTRASADAQAPNIGPGDHIVYYARARSLGLDHRLIMDHPLIEQIQALGILGLYLIVNHQISRAWTTVGHAIRHAIALGLHLRIGAGIDVNELQHRSRTWWALYGLEQLLGDFTGRPTSIPDSDIAIPLDWSKKGEVASPSSEIDSRAMGTQRAFPSESSTGLEAMKFSPHLYFVCRTRLSILGHKIRSSLYASGRTNEPWSKFQQSIRDFDQELTRWSSNLPEAMRLPPRIDIQMSGRSQDRLRDQFELAMAYQSTRMILFRPCLCHLEGVIPYESALSRGINHQAAVSCVNAARTLLALLPKGLSSTHPSQMLPCWSLLHYLTQAGAVLFLELGLKAEHMPLQAKELLDDTGKVIAWLADMATDSLSAWRSWEICRKLYLQAVAGMGVNVMIPENIQKPPGWKPAYEQLLSQAINVPANQQQNLQMLHHLHPQVGMSFVPASDTMFMQDLTQASWPLLPEMPVSGGTMAFDGPEVYPPSTRDMAGEMDWRT